VNAIPASYRTLIAAATQRGIVVNYPNVKSLSLNTVATRAEVAAFIYQALVSTGEMTAISSPYVVGGEMGTVELNQTGGQTINQTGGGMINQGETEVEGDRHKPRQHCNQGIGNGAEGCDPGNSHPHGGSNDEGGRTPGNRR
ncbi:MAG TPA: S-layer homology domain-containing protein, partial [Cyanophyceae cyanobacterium]